MQLTAKKCDTNNQAYAAMNQTDFIFDPDTTPWVQAAKARAAADPLIDIKGAAQMLGVTVRTVRRWEAAKKMPKRTKVRHRWKYRKADIAAMMAAKPRDDQP